jgi:hypothetical protein
MYDYRCIDPMSPSVETNFGVPFWNSDFPTDVIGNGSFDPSMKPQFFNGCCGRFIVQEDADLILQENGSSGILTEVGA